MVLACIYYSKVFTKLTWILKGLLCVKDGEETVERIGGKQGDQTRG